MGKALPSGLHRCEVHDRTFLTGCLDCAHDRIFGVHDECSGVPASDIVAVAQPTYAVWTANVIGTGSWTRGWLFDERFADPRAEFEQTEAQQLVSEWPNCAKSDWVASHDALVERLSQAATEEIGTPYDVFVERDLCSRMIDVTMRCRSCKYEQQASWPKHYTVETGWADKAFALLMEAWQADNEPDGQGCDCLDGLTEAQILAHYTSMQREGGDVHAFLLLTDRQTEAARALWSSSLRTLQSEQREKERVAIVCDDDRWDE